MRHFLRLAATAAALFTPALLSGPALADPGEEHGHDGIPVPPPSLPNFGPGASGIGLLGLSDKDGATNSDLAFYGSRAYAGNYDGFRIFDIRNPTRPRLLADVRCRAVQSDLSVFRADGGRLFLLQSIDRPVTAPDCSGVDTGTTIENEPGPDGQPGVPRTRARFGYEGLRLFDVTDSSNPRYMGFFRTECGSHTHTLVPDRANGVVHAYIPSYPLGTGITPEVDRQAAGSLFCDAPHAKISIVDIPLSDPAAGSVRTQPLSSDTETYDPDGPYDPTGGETGGPSGTQAAFTACHDFQAFMPRDVIVGSCAGDVQYWSIRSRGEPTSADGQPHTHIKREDGTTESFDFIHNAVVTWDGRMVAVSDESGGGSEARCDGPNTKRGFTFFYPLVEPGQRVDGFADLRGRYIIPRPQSSEICVSHNGITVPTADGRYLMTQAFYQGGNSFYDFTNPAAAREIGYTDLETGTGSSDSWSSYWYNGVMYVNGGLNRRNAPGQTAGNRGFEAYRLTDEDGRRLQTKRWRHLNPQTQEAFQVPDFSP
jgi:hypothetical protein